MREINVKKMALAVALLAFGILGIGSALNGARILTAGGRAFAGALIFGLVAWGLGSFLIEDGYEEGPVSEEPPEQEDNKGSNLDQQV